MLHIATYKITWILKFNGSERESEFGDYEKTKTVKRRGKNVSAGEKNGVRFRTP
jgi:hypothetical protein